MKSSPQPHTVNPVVMTCIRLLISQGYPFNYFFFYRWTFFQTNSIPPHGCFLDFVCRHGYRNCTKLFFNLNFIEGKIYTVNPEAFIVRNCSMLCTTVRTLRALGRIHCEKGVGGISSTNEVPEALYVQITHSLHIIYLIKQL